MHDNVVVIIMKTDIDCYIIDEEKRYLGGYQRVLFHMIPLYEDC